MKGRDLLYLIRFGLTTVLLHRQDPLVGSLILTDRCNLACRHCAVANKARVIYPYSSVRRDMEHLYRQGVRILLFYGGEPFLWEDSDRTLRDLVSEAKAMGFILVQVVTNGTFPLDLPEADLILVSLDGNRRHHNEIRGDTYDRILNHIAAAPNRNICLYMAVNNINWQDIEEVSRLAQRLTKVKAVAFNFHTPYPGVESLQLSGEETRSAVQAITALKQDGLPILNLVRALPRLIEHRFPAPCRQCVVMENGAGWTCGRCIEIPGLCEKCGFAFAAELSLVFQGNLPVVGEFLRTYLRQF